MDHTRRQNVYTPNYVTDAATSSATPNNTQPDASRHVAHPNEKRPDLATTPTVKSTDQPEQSPVPRHIFTLTVEDVAVKLADLNLYRDPRTIQRWCQSGRLNAIVDQENKDRYLIQASSVADMVATIEADAAKRSRHGHDTSRQETRRAESRHDIAATPSEKTLPTNADTSDDAATHEPTYGDASRRSRDDDATSKERISELETKLAIAEAEKQARGALVEYMKEQFEKMANGALDRAEQVGELRAENAQLKSLLGDRSSTVGENNSPSMGV